MSKCDTDYLGNKEWFRDGKYHRDDGPAIEWTDGSLWWHQNGKLHRDDGPAMVDADGTKEWFLNGIKYTQEEFIMLQFTKGIIINE